MRSDARQRRYVVTLGVKSLRSVTFTEHCMLLPVKRFVKRRAR